MNFLGEEMTIIQFFQTLHFPAALWVILFAMILFKIDDIGKK